MSTVTDAAELDAAIAENELEETAAERLRELVQEGAALPDALEQTLAERDGTKPPPRLPETAEEPTGEPTDKQLKALDRETDRHLGRVLEIMGAHVAGFTPCEHCDGLGLMPPGPQPKGHEFFEPCPTCNGFGEVFTGSLREGQRSRDCPACAGRGYLEELDEHGAPRAANPAASAISTSPAPPPPAELERADTNGATGERRMGVPAWMGDPNLGR